jgi:hypothetical protein
MEGSDVLIPGILVEAKDECSIMDLYLYVIHNVFVSFNGQRFTLTLAIKHLARTGQREASAVAYWTPFLDDVPIPLNRPQSRGSYLVDSHAAEQDQCSDCKENRE